MTLNSRTMVAFIDSVFSQMKAAHFNIKTAWLGQSLLRPPTIIQLIISRFQDTSHLFKAGRQGLPMLILSGTADKQVSGDALVEEMRPHFKNLEVQMVKDGSHALSYEHEEEVVTALLRFTERVTVNLNALYHTLL